MTMVDLQPIGNVIAKNLMHGDRVKVNGTEYIVDHIIDYGPSESIVAIFQGHYETHYGQNDLIPIF